jgi:hypothetical protein
MSNDEPLPASDDADPEKETTPAGVVRDLEAEAAETGATTDDEDPPAGR